MGGLLLLWGRNCPIPHQVGCRKGLRPSLRRRFGFRYIGAATEGTDTPGVGTSVDVASVTPKDAPPFTVGVGSDVDTASVVGVKLDPALIVKAKDVVAAMAV